MKHFTIVKSLLLLCALIAGSSSVWAETKPWSCDDPTTTLDLQTVTSSNIGTFGDATSYYIGDDYLVVSGYVSRIATKPSWISHNDAGSSGSSWDTVENEPFKGSSYYTTQNYTTLQSGRAIVYRVTNLKSIKVYGKNNSTSKYLDIFIYTKSGNDYTKVEEIKYTTDANIHIWESSETLDTDETYYIYITGVGNSNSRVFEVAFERNTGDSEDPTLSFPESSYTATLGDSFSAPTLTNNSNGTLSYASSNTDVATVTNAGVVTLKACGTTRITASTTATSKYNAGSTYYDLNVNAVVAPTITYDGTEYASGSSATKKAGKTLTFTTTAPDAEIWYTTDGSTDPDATNSTGTKYTGDITVNATTTFKARTYVLDVEANDVQSSVVTFTVNITTEKETPTFSFASSAESVTYGDDFTEPVLTNTSSETPAYESSNTYVATVDAEGNVTILSVGTTTISASVDENEDYNAANASYTLTVTENTSAPAIIAVTTVLNETFDTNDQTGGNDGTWSSISTTPTPSFDLTGWTYSTAYAGKQCVRTGKSGHITSPALGVEGDVTLTFKMASWGNDTNNGYVDILNGGTFDGDSKTQQLVSIKKSEWDSFELTLYDVTEDTKIKFSDNGNNKRLFIDEVKVTQSTTPTVSATIPSSGWGTYCSPYKLDLSNETTEVTAYAVTGFNAEEGKITFTKATGVVPAKTPLVIYGEAGSKKIAVDQTAATGTAPAGNLLVGYLSPTYYDGDRSDNTLFALSGGNFHKLTAGTIKANKAVLSMSTTEANKVPVNSEGKFTFVFNDGGTTKINLNVNDNLNCNATRYNLAGQKVSSSYKGIVIVNGKKYFVK